MKREAFSRWLSLKEGWLAEADVNNEPEQTKPAETSLIVVNNPLQKTKRNTMENSNAAPTETDIVTRRLIDRPDLLLRSCAVMCFADVYVHRSGQYFMWPRNPQHSPLAVLHTLPTCHVIVL